MKKIPFILVRGILALLVAFGNTAPSFAQVPSHPHYVKQYPINPETQTSEGFYSFFTAWDENNPQVTDDDNFYISRVRLAERFEDPSTQYDSELTPERKVLWWCPAGVSDKYWSSLPRYIFNADAFSSWSMIDIHGNWADGIGRVPGAFSDAAHLNGVQNGCVMFWEREFNSDSDYWKLFKDLSKKDESGDYSNCRKFIRFLRYYGIDGIGINPEGSTSQIATLIKDVLEQLHRVAQEEGWHFRVDWYDSQNNNGSVQYANALKANNSQWFQRPNKDYPVCDVFFLNYNWGSSHLNSSEAKAKELGRNPYDVYAGFDIQGRGLSSDLNQPSDSKGWTLLPSFEISIGIWGAHGKNMLYENSNELGSTDYAIQNMYQSKQEQFFYSGTRNLRTAPPITNLIKSFGTKSMERFHGLAKLTPARSTLTSLPFVTYFNLGNGQGLWNDGGVVFDQQWYNLGSQTILPTWRWWITATAEESSEAENQKLINAQLCYDKAWKGGSSLRLYGESQYSEIRLFKTQFELNGDENITIRYYLTSAPGKLYVIWSEDGKSINRYPILTKEEAPEEASWVAFEATTKDIGMTSVVRMLGLAVENADSDFELYVGEFGLTDTKIYNPVSPEITTFQLLRQSHKEVDFKLIWNSTPQSNNSFTEERKSWLSVYNDEVDTWYFEVLSQEEGQKPVLLGTTTSWASYVVGATVSNDIERKVRFGVRAVAPNGVTKSEIAWTDYVVRHLDEMEIDESVTVDHTNLIAGDEFTIAFEDPYHPESFFKIVNASTEETVFSSENPTQSITTTLNEQGVYDVVVGDTKYSSMIYVTPESTGAFPIINSLQVVREGERNHIGKDDCEDDCEDDKESVEASQELNWAQEVNPDNGGEEDTQTEVNVDEEFAVIMSGRKGEGYVSKGLVLEDPVMVRFSPEMCSAPEFTIAFWVKPTTWAHGRFGTNLLNKRNLGAKWPHNNWGTLWCHIWPETPVCDGLNPNTLSMTQFGNTKMNYPEGIFPSGTHEGPNMGCIANDVTMRLNCWYHVAFSVAQDKMSLFVNGSLVATQEVDWATNPNGEKDPSKNQYVYIGGSNVYHGGLIGVIDDVQYWDVYTQDQEMVNDMMKGYFGREIPQHLMGYWDFEDVGQTTEEQDSATRSTLTNRGRNSDLIAQTMYLTSAGGEDTSAAEVVYTEKDNNTIGYPGLEGTFGVKTEACLETPEDLVRIPANEESEENEGIDNVVTIEFFTAPTAGSKTITGKLSNVFGTDSKDLDIKVVDQSQGFENVTIVNDIKLVFDKEDMTVWFAQDGTYSITVYSSTGQLLSKQSNNVDKNTRARINLGSNHGVYVITVSDEKSAVLKSWKIMK